MEVELFVISLSLLNIAFFILGNYNGSLFSFTVCFKKTRQISCFLKERENIFVANKVVRAIENKIE